MTITDLFTAAYIGEYNEKMKILRVEASGSSISCNELSSQVSPEKKQKLVAEEWKRKLHSSSKKWPLNFKLKEDSQLWNWSKIY